ncbi:MAG TPA: hypothetical protein VLM89_00260 [Phycisphaerae bacterium]|nr:hypothetical protein [Phycisphaerae bacterium]
MRKEWTERTAAPGVDGQTWRAYGENLDENLQDLSERLKRGAYRAKPVRRTYIPKADGRQRPLGVPMNGLALSVFRYRVGWLWHRVLERCSQTGFVSWERMCRLIELWLPPAHVCHPYPLRRMGVIT